MNNPVNVWQRNNNENICGHIPKIQKHAFSLCWAIFIVVVVLKWSQGGGSEKYDVFVCVLLLLFRLALTLAATRCQILPTVP